MQRRSWPTTFLPIVLVLVAIASGAMAVQAEKEGRPPKSLGQRAPITPVLAARRVPEIVVAPVATRRLSARLAEFLTRSPGAACLTVAADGRSAFVANPTRPMTPASLEKLVTAHAAIDELGADTRLTTLVRAAGSPQGGAVSGDLYLVGGGDPLLMTEDYVTALKHPPPERSSLERLADGVVAAGVRSVSGRVVGDESRYDRVRYSPKWAAGIATGVSIGPMSALTVNGGLDAFPPTPDLHKPAPHPAADPAAMAAARLSDLLKARGVTIAGEPASGAAPVGGANLARIDSAPVSGLVAEMLRESDNTTAELLTKEMGLKRSGTGSTDAGIAVINADAASLGLPLDGVARVDGSGLATENKLTCSFVQGILDSATPSGELTKGLAVGGQTGTLEDRFKGAVAGRLRAKTGTLNQVTALAGYLPTAKGSAISFAYILNLSRPERITQGDIDLQEELAAILDTYPETPDAALLGPKPLP